MPDPLPFLQKLRQSLEADTFVKLTLSAYSGPEKALRNVYGRPVALREGAHFSLLWRYATRDVTRNFPLGGASEQVRALLESGFRNAHLFTSQGDWQWREGKLKASRPAFTEVPPREHDRAKQRPVDLTEAPFLRLLEVSPSKLRQIQRFVELLAHLAPESELPRDRPLQVLDLGAGKGYLTFALAAFLRERGIAAEITGVELREELVALTNRVAAQAGFPELRFVQGEAGGYRAEHPPDWVIALHACDTATDDALFHGVQSGATLILAAPCCHRELRPQMSIPAVLAPILRHGILLEHEAAQVTDAIRALLLEIHGYKTSIFEFISAEHTDKNLMLSAQKRATPISPEPLRAQLATLLDFYGLRSQHLLHLLSSHAAPL